MQLTESQFNILMNVVDTKIQLAIQTEIGGEIDNLIKECDKLIAELKSILVE